MTSPHVLVIDDSPTILKVVQLVLSKSGCEVSIADNGEEGILKARSKRPDLILLDFVMPKMNGYQVCRALSADEDLGDIPVVLMSAKGDQVGERFVKVMGIVDYITKPFSPEAITAVVQHTIAKFGRSDAMDTSTRELVVRPLEHSAFGDSEDEATQDERAVALGNLRSRLGEGLSPQIANVLSLAREAVSAESNQEDNQAIETQAVEDAVVSVLDDDFLGRIFLELQPVFEEAKLGPSLSGDVRFFPIAEVLQLLDAQRQSGILRIRRGAAHVEVCFRDGCIDLALSGQESEEFFLGRYLVQNQLISQADLDGFLESRAPSSQLLGNQLVKLGYISQSELTSTLQEQTRELIYEILRWSAGRFDFLNTDKLPAPALDATLGLEVEGILMEGFRRVDEWHLIEREISDFETIFLRNDDAVAHMGRGRLTREELNVLELVNGKNTVKELIRESKMGSYEVSKMLYRLSSIKLIRRRVQPIAV